MVSDSYPVIERVLDGLFRVEIPLPNLALKSLNSYFIITPDRNLVIDTGMDLPECLKVMQAAMKKLGVDIDKTDFMITHQHIDHIGLIVFLAGKKNRVYFNTLEARLMTTVSLQEWAREATNFARRHGFPERYAREMQNNINRMRDNTNNYPEFTTISEGDVIEIGDYSFKCIHTPGHTRGHMCLYEPDKKLFFSGDHILDDITPNISTRYNDIENPLSEYLQSLEKIYALDIKLCLPGHRNLIIDFRGRIDALKSHHEQRAQEILEILQDGEMDAYRVASKMSWDMTYETWEDFPVFPKWFAFSEALSHLQYLEAIGKVQKLISKEGKVVYRSKLD